MKRYFLILLVIISISACSPSSNDDINQHFEYVPITSVEMPSEFTLGQTYQIKVSYVLPNGCYRFYNHDYVYENTSRLIGAIAIVNNDATCTQAAIEGEFTINVIARQNEPYIFMFWEGRDNQGIDQYLIIEVPVI
ncbi:MAG: hypothetical protein COA67_04545 [Lutibacter sp.]|nr:MAG: hypothetical protein COA67_04545 [Lutibacter sp.]